MLDSVQVHGAARPAGAVEGVPAAPGERGTVSPGFDVAGIILRCRRTADLSQRELAHLLGVSPSTVARWETGERIPGADVLAAVADLAGYRLGLVNHRHEPVAAAPSETLRDRAGRRAPAHLDVHLWEETVWQRDWSAPGGWVCFERTVHAPRRRWRDRKRDDYARLPVQRAPGCVPFHGQAMRRWCHDVTTAADHEHWQATLAATRQARLDLVRQRQPRLPDPEPCTCADVCYRLPHCMADCSCQCESAASMGRHSPH